ncbi:type II toxin-antitoxin system HicA family toxin [Dehalococcoidales bacterium]|nr:type II toxin-antitoxin system HicA family toxin [Dehalococcoidales bacterium]
MSIDYSKLRSLTARRLISALIQDGFKLEREKGSHRQYIHPEKGRVTLSFHHPSDTFPPKTLKGIIHDTGWTEEDLKRLGLLR